MSNPATTEVGYIPPPMKNDCRNSKEEVNDGIRFKCRVDLAAPAEGTVVASPDKG